MNTTQEKESEVLTLPQAARYLLEECRTVLPGMQALFGFQLIAVFNQTFGEKCSSLEQKLHLVALIMVAIAIALVMTPAAIHRQTGARLVTNEFVESSTKLLLTSMFPLLSGICIELYLIARLITNSKEISLMISFFVLAVFASLWFFFPRSRIFHRSRGAS
jgi:Family of unknown function (DUF6328)